MKPVPVPVLSRLRRRACLVGLLLPALYLPVNALAQEGDACEPWVERQGETARLRAHLDAFVSCRIDEATYARLVRKALAADEHLPAPASIALGRIEDMPWLSRALQEAALADPGWNARRGKPRGEPVNALVARLLQSAPIRERLAAPLAEQGYVLSAVSVEKVLVRKLSETGSNAGPASARVPVDAQVWLRVEVAP